MKLPAPLARVRRICLALPEVTEKTAWGEATFRVRDRMFAMCDDNHHDEGRIAVWCKATILDQAMLVQTHPRQCFVPPYVGPKGWIGVRVDGRPSWQLVTDVLEAAYRLTAPPSLVARLGARRTSVNGGQSRPR